VAHSKGDRSPDRGSRGGSSIAFGSRLTWILFPPRSEVGSWPASGIATPLPKCE
jgi:hypothetical protein